MAHVHFTHNGTKQTRYEFDTTDSHAKAVSDALTHLRKHGQEAVDLEVVVTMEEDAAPNPDFVEVRVPFSEISHENIFKNDIVLAEEGLQHELEYQTIMNSVRDKKILPIRAL